MAKFILIYKGDAADMSAMTPEQMKEVMGKWEAWTKGVGSALVDIGAPFGPSSSVVDDGTMGTPAQCTGYSIVEAGNLAEAQSLTDGHPYLSEGYGKYAIDLFELKPVPMDM